MSSTPEIETICRNARAAADVWENMCGDDKNTALRALAAALENATEDLCAAHAQDMDDAQEKGLSKDVADRLRLTDTRVHAMASRLRAIAQLPDPVGALLGHSTRSCGTSIIKVRVPLGVILCVFDTPPDAITDAIGVCLKSGNTLIMCGTRLCSSTQRILAEICFNVFIAHALPAPSVTFIIEATDAYITEFLHAQDSIDVAIPRGDKTLVHSIMTEARMPVIPQPHRVCHMYISAQADADTACRIIHENLAHTADTGATSILLVNDIIAPHFIPFLFAQLKDCHVYLCGDAHVRGYDPTVAPITDVTPFNALTVYVVSHCDEAIAHINASHSRHSDAIITNDEHEAAHFLRAVRSAAVYVNTCVDDTILHDRNAHMGFSAAAIHARGPVGLEELTTYKYVIRGAEKQCE